MDPKTGSEMESTQVPRLLATPQPAKWGAHSVLLRVPPTLALLGMKRSRAPAVTALRASVGARPRAGNWLAAGRLCTLDGRRSAAWWRIQRTPGEG